MGAVYAGSTPKYLVKIKDEEGLQLNPSLVASVKEVKIFLFNAITGTDIGKFYLNTAPEVSGWTKMTTKDLGNGDIRVLLALTADQTKAAEGNSNSIQIDIHVPDAEVAGGTRIIIEKGKFHEILSAKS